MRRILLTSIPVMIDWRRVADRAGMKGELSGNLRIIAEELSKEAAASLLDCKASISVAGFSAGDGRIVTEHGQAFASRGLESMLMGAELVVMMVVTAGPGIGAASAGAMEAGRYTRGIFLDAIGSVAVESAADWVQERSLAAARKDPELYRYSERFSPGYCDWPLGEQKALLEAAGADLVDVTLNASMMMAPEKSVSAVFGIGKRVEYDGRRRPPCGECERAAGCSYRRAG